MKYLTISLYSLLLTAAAFSCTNPTRPASEEATTEQQPQTPIEQAILQDQGSFYYVDFQNYPSRDRSLPIGVFDSGTGGLTVLDALVNFDQHRNSDKAAGADNAPDFAGEQFIYLADQANMPYGNYSSVDKTDLLVEHVLKDAQFLLSDKYYASASAPQAQTDKQKVKAIVIACNTATAYGKTYIEDFIRKTGTNLKVIGVIDAGARGTLQVFGKGESGAVGVFATVGTIASKGYERTILKMKKDLGYTGDIQVYNQGGHGVAEAVDEEPDFITRTAKTPRKDYRGPGLENAEYRIDKTLLDVYNFDFDHGKMLCDAQDTDDCQVLQLNSADNYVRYHLVSLLEKMRKTPGAKPLKALVLGCTHYPYLTQDIRQVLGELYSYQKEGKYIYRDLLAPEVQIIDPAVNVAQELHAFLQEQNLFNPSGSMQSSEFYISVPNPANPQVVTDPNGRFTYDYKYGRTEGQIQEYVKVVPFSRANIPAETIARFKASIPATYSLIQAFHQGNAKTAALPEGEKIGR